MHSGTAQWNEELLPVSQNISTESVMYDCQQLQLMVKNDNDYT